MPRAVSTNAEILRRLERIERDVSEIKLEVAESRGAWRLAKFVVALLSVSGIGGVLAWLQGQAK